MLNEEIKKRLIANLFLYICLIGLFLRAYFFLINRSLWLDEAMLGVNIVNRSFLDLLKPLDFGQGAPIGFLFLQKAVVVLLGSSDYALRLIPLLAGLASIPIMYSVSKQYVGQLSALISVGLFALSAKLIYYSSELKQYSTDVLITLLLLLIIPKCLDKAKSRTLIMLGITGSLSIWLSHPSLFVCAGIFLTLSLIFALHKDSYRLFWLIGIGALWAINLVIIYFINLRHLESSNSLMSYWSGSFAPFPIWENLSWYYNAFIDMLRDPAALPANAIVAALLIIGVFSFAFQRWQLMLVLLAPFLLTLAASALGRYPFSGRLLLFLLPLLFLFIAEGVNRVRMMLLRVNKYFAGFVFASLFVYFLYEPIDVAYKNLKSPPLGEHIKPVMAYVSKNYRPTDLIYVYYGARPAFEFYAPIYGFERNDYIVGLEARNDPSKYIEDIEKLRGSQRIWFIFSHNCIWCIVNEQGFILEHLNKIGVKTRELLSDGAAGYLYDLGQIQQ